MKRVVGAGARRGAAGLAVLILACAGCLTAPVAAQTPEPLTDGVALLEAASLAVHWGDFGEAERLYQRVRQDARRTTAGQPESTPLRSGLERGLAPSDGLRVRQAEHSAAMTAQWAEQNPRSALAHALHMEALSNLAWAYRGSGYANTVPQLAWARFREVGERATRFAALQAEVLLSDSLGYRQLLTLSRYAEWDDKRTQAVYQQAVARFPDDDALHFAQLTNLLPKWGGSPRLVDQHIEAVTRSTQATRGLSLYAWLYHAAAQDQFSQALFTDSLARWERVDRGFADLTAQYPHPRHFNAWAWLACQAQDRKRLLELLDKLGPEPLLSHWGSNARATHDTCKAWAQKL